MTGGLVWLTAAVAAAVGFVRDAAAAGGFGPSGAGEAGEARRLAVVEDAFAAALRAVEGEAERLGAPPRELAATLILAVAWEGWVAAGQVGDGAAVAEDEAGDVVSLTFPRNGEYVNETTFLTSAGALEDVQAVFRRGRFAHLALLTDGLQMLAQAMPAGTAHPPFFRPLFAFLDGAADGEAAARGLESFLRSPRVRKEADDDLTLVLAARVAR